MVELAEEPRPVLGAALDFSQQALDVLDDGGVSPVGDGLRARSGENAEWLERARGVVRRRSGFRERARGVVRRRSGFRTRARAKGG